MHEQLDEQGIDPWAHLAQTDLVLLRLEISERGRYYHHQRAIVDVDLVQTRYRTMHPAERALLHKELDNRLERIA